MPNGQLGAVVDYLRRMAVVSPSEDGPLLERFATTGMKPPLRPLVSGDTSRSSMASAGGSSPNEHDAEDAFQATFLVLARKAGRSANTNR